LYIVRPDLQEEEVQTVANEVEALITGNGGEIQKSEQWGKRKLAYEVQKFGEGYYVLVRFTAPAGLTARLENHFRLTDAIIRFLLLHFDERTLRLEENQRKRKEAEARIAATSRRRDEDEDEDEDAAPARSRKYANDDDDTEED
jgi:small subunit ribosomal protein S6